MSFNYFDSFTILNTIVIIILVSVINIKRKQDSDFIYNTYKQQQNAMSLIIYITASFILLFLMYTLMTSNNNKHYNYIILFNIIINIMCYIMINYINPDYFAFQAVYASTLYIIITLVTLIIYGHYNKTPLNEYIIIIYILGLYLSAAIFITINIYYIDPTILQNNTLDIAAILFICIACFCMDFFTNKKSQKSIKFIIFCILSNIILLLLNNLMLFNTDITTYFKIFKEPTLTDITKYELKDEIINKDTENIINKNIIKIEFLVTIFTIILIIIILILLISVFFLLEKTIYIIFVLALLCAVLIVIIFKELVIKRLQIK